MELKTIIFAILVFGALVGLYIFLFLMNKKTPLPPGCENLKAECKGCHDLSCMNNPQYNQKKEDE